MTSNALQAEAVPNAPRSLIQSLLCRPITYALASSVLSFASAGVGLLIPALLDPLQFGVFVLVSTVFQYAQTFDFGMAQMMDRTIGRSAGSMEGQTGRTVGRILWVRLYIAAIFVGLLAGAAITIHMPGVSGWVLLTAGLGGVSFTASMGPVSLYRARADNSRFTIYALILQLGMVVPRPIGILAYGISGCFGCLLIWYATIAVLLNAKVRSFYGKAPTPVQAGRLLAAATPLALNLVLLVAFLTAHRWIAAVLSAPEDFGYYAFGANLTAMILGTMTPIGQIYYPRRVHQIADIGTERMHRVITRDMAMLLVVMIVSCSAGQAFLPYAVDMVFPAYRPAVPVTSILLMTIIPLVLVTWLSPLTLSVCAQPWFVALPLVSALLIGLAGIWIAGSLMGMLGQAWAYVASALILLTFQLEVAVRVGILQRMAMILLTLLCLIHLLLMFLIIEII